MSKKAQNSKEGKQNNTMFLYTALIFVVALILIILAFFGQKNLTNLRSSTENILPTQTVQTTESIETPQPTESTTSAKSEDLAILTNSLSNLKAENDKLSDQISVYELLLAANGYTTVGNTDEAAELLNNIDTSVLTDDQIILYNQILNTINEGKGQ